MIEKNVVEELVLWKYEINGNLYGSTGLKNIDLFHKTIVKVAAYFFRYYNIKFPNGVEIYVDNATCNSGYTPITTPVLKKILIIKLCITQMDPSSKIAFQFAHEMMHCAFYAKYGLDRDGAKEKEETICTAASLIYLHDVDLEGFSLQNEYVKSLQNEKYRNGAVLAEETGYDFSKLVEMV